MDHKHAAFLCLVLIPAIPCMPRTPASAPFPPPAPRLTRIAVDLRSTIEPVNRRVFGVCAIMPPLDAPLTAFCRGVLDGASVRLWANTRFFGGSPDDLSVCEDAWTRAMRFVSGAGFSECYAFWPFSHLGHKARYVSGKNNNLEPRHQPSALAEYLRWLNGTPHPGFPRGLRVKCWEIWNEPQFPQSGAWPADDYARYVLDCSRAMRAVQPDVEIGACLHESDMEWNRRMLNRIAAADVGAIDFVVTHPYDFSWIRSRHRMGSYYARVSGSEPLRERLRAKAELVLRLGHGRWRVAATEWNTHPPGYDPPYDVSTDMAVAIHIAGMFGAFWDAAIDAATFFQLVNRGGGKPGHFSLAARTEDGLRLRPTGEVFFLYGRYFRGRRLNVRIDCPTYSYFDASGDVVCPVPLVIAHAAYDARHRRLVLILANRHKERPAPAAIRLSNFAPASRTVKRILITAEEPGLTKPLRKETWESLLPPGEDPAFRVALPPHSVTALLLSGDIPPTESELFSGRIRFVRVWKVGAIVPPPGGPHHGLDAPLPEQARRVSQTLQASSGGYVNLAGLLDVTGESQDLREGWQALARCWVFSPAARTAGLSAGFDYWGIVSVNGRETLAVRERRGPPRPDTHRVSARLNAGWNRLDVRVASGSRGMGFWLGIEDAGDLQYAATDREPPWPNKWAVVADEGADVNAFEKFRTMPRPRRTVLELAPHPERLAFVRWPVHPPPGRYNGIRARIALTPAYVRGRGHVWIRPVLDPWDESTLCFANQPRLGEPLPARVDVNDKTWTFSGPAVDALVRQWLRDPARNFGIAVESDVTRYAAFYSDDEPGRAPGLIIDTGTTAPPDGGDRARQKPAP